MSTPPRRIAIFVSGTGSNARVMIDRFQHHPDDGVEVVLLVSNRAAAPALQMAAERGVPTLVLRRPTFYESEELLEQLAALRVDAIVLAGFLWLIPPYLVRAFPDRIINIHPALLPKYGGKGMYGQHVHRAVHAAGETESGITIHYVNERYDEGAFIRQERVPLEAGDGPEDIARRVLALEHRWYWETVRDALTAP